MEDSCTTPSTRRRSPRRRWRRRVAEHSFVIIYVDDWLFVSVDEEQLRRQCLTLIFWLHKFQLYINPKKSKIGCESVSFLGWIVGYNLQFANPERVRAMALVPEPKTKKAVRRFLGGTAFYRETVDGYGLLAAPLHRCTRNERNGMLSGMHPGPSRVFCGHCSHA